VILGVSIAGRAQQTGATSSAKPPQVAKLPIVHELPDPFKFNDGKRVKTRADWDRRRAELLREFQELEYGHVPSDGGEVKAGEAHTDHDSSSGATIRQLTLNMGPDGKVSTHLILTIPQGEGPFPIIIKGDLCWGRIKPEIVNEVIRRGYMLAEFDRTEIAPDKNDRGVGVFPLYPEYDWGCLGAWAWGYSRVIDYVSTLPNVDRDKIIITGHSRCGKATLLAGALDTRVALTVPNGSGCGGAGCYRIYWPMSEDIKAIVTHFPFWFAPHFDEFIGHVDQLPIDQHELKALIAPRALLTTDSLDDLWANPLGTQISYLASKPVFEFLGAGEKTGLHYRHGKHEQNAEDFAALLDFADWQLRGKQPAQKFDNLPFPQFPPVRTWKAPQRMEQ